MAQHHGNGTDARLFGQHGFDLTQFDAETANLDLVIGAAQALHAAVRVDARQVASAVEPGLLGAAGPRVGQEFFGAQVGAAQIARRHARAGDAQLADFAAWQQRQAAFNVGADDQQAVIGQWPANRHRLARMQLGQAGGHRGFGRAVGVEHLATGPRPARHQRLRTHFATQVDQPQAGHVLVEQRQQRRHGVQHGDVVLFQRAGQRFGVGRHFLGRKPQRGTGQVADPDFLERHVKGD